MKYELAKELKDAGFPQHTESMDGPGRWDNAEGELVYYPTLSELIECCGAEFDGIDKLSVAWGARGYTDKHEAVSAVGSTPEEAVARLWLALNPQA